jgi:glutathione S-transferase
MICGGLVTQGVPYDLVNIDLTCKGQKDPRYLELHPFGKVPTIVLHEPGQPLSVRPFPFARCPCFRTWTRA